MCMHTHHTLLHPYCYHTVPSLRGPALIVSMQGKHWKPSYLISSPSVTLVCTCDVAVRCTRIALPATAPVLYSY